MDHEEDTRCEEVPEFDVELLEHNLELSYEDRLLEHQRALDLVLELEAAGKGYYDKQSQQPS